MVNWKEKFLFIGLFFVAYYIFYVYPNFYPLFPPRQMVTLKIDQSLPFLPWTFVIYVSCYFLIAIVIILLKTPLEIYSFTRRAFGVLIACGLFFLLYPTVYPRPEYSIVENGYLKLILHFIATVDKPGNCFPSLHVAMTAVSVWSMHSVNSFLFKIFIFWGAAICLSTLTTKQHYFVDILGGILIAGLVGFLEWKWFKQKARLKLALEKMNMQSQLHSIH